MRSETVTAGIPSPLRQGCPGNRNRLQKRATLQPVDVMAGQAQLLRLLVERHKNLPASHARFRSRTIVNGGGVRREK